eukprot:105531-Chlamydomonas_euryale.AAC.1
MAGGSVGRDALAPAPVGGVRTARGGRGAAGSDGQAGKERGRVAPPPPAPKVVQHARQHQVAVLSAAAAACREGGRTWTPAPGRSAQRSSRGLNKAGGDGEGWRGWRRMRPFNLA